MTSWVIIGDSISAFINSLFTFSFVLAMFNFCIPCFNWVIFILEIGIRREGVLVLRHTAVKPSPSQITFNCSTYYNISRQPEPNLPIFQHPIEERPRSQPTWSQLCSESCLSPLHTTLPRLLYIYIFLLPYNWISTLNRHLGSCIGKGSPNRKIKKLKEV